MSTGSCKSVEVVNFNYFFFIGHFIIFENELRLEKNFRLAPSKRINNQSRAFPLVDAGKRANLF